MQSIKKTKFINYKYGFNYALILVNYEEKIHIKSLFLIYFVIVMVFSYL